MTMRQRSAVRALIWPLGVLACLLAVLGYIATLSPGGHPEGKGLAFAMYLYCVLPVGSLIGLLLSTIAYVKQREFRAPALALWAMYGAAALYSLPDFLRVLAISSH